jgi:hypothetical protein
MAVCLTMMPRDRDEHPGDNESEREPIQKCSVLQPAPSPDLVGQRIHLRWSARKNLRAEKKGSELSSVSSCKASLQKRALPQRSRAWKCKSRQARFLDPVRRNLAEPT